MAVASRLRRRGREVHFFDANLSFFTQFFLSGAQLHRSPAAVRSDAPRRRVQPAGGKGSADAVRVPWAADGSRVRDALDVLRSAAFYRPSDYAAAAATIRNLLGRVSQSAKPATLDWGGFYHPGLQSPDRVDRFAGSRSDNPFYDYALGHLAPRLRRRRPDRVVLTVDTAGQVAAARTLAACCRREHPGVRVEFVAGPAAAGPAAAAGGPDPWPDYAPSELAAYCCPSPVLAVGPCAAPVRIGDWFDAMYRDFSVVGFDMAPPADETAAMVGGRAGEAIPYGLSVAVDGDTRDSREGLRRALRTGARLLNWKLTAARLSEQAPMLREAAKSGVWNHLCVAVTGEGGPDTGDAIGWLSANPQSAHSWNLRMEGALAAAGVRRYRPDRWQGYASVAPIPGAPFWSILLDPVHLLLYLRHFGHARLQRLRIDAAQSPFFVGDHLVYRYDPPEALSSALRDEISRMVAAGGSVDAKWVRYNIDRAYLIGYVTEGGVVVANSSLKHPRPEYARHVSRQTGIDLSGFLERGYTSVRPEYRGMGIGTRLLEGLTQRAQDRPIFSVIGEDNIATQTIALRNRTQRVTTFYSERAGKTVGVWMPESVIATLRRRPDA
jgi:GNAT superfamily N-acetyltransferase